MTANVVPYRAQNFPNKTGGAADDMALTVVRMYDAAEGGRGNWEQQWEEIARRILPQYAYTFTSQDYLNSNGQRKTEQMVDATGALALPKFAAAMESMLTPRNQTWSYIKPVDKALLRNRTARMWFDDANETLFRYRYAPRANFASQVHESWMGLGAFGTAPLYIDPLSGSQKGIRYRALHLGEVYFMENHQGIIDTALRKYPLTARQAAQQFTPEKLPPEILTKLGDPQQENTVKFWFIQCVRPRAEMDNNYDPQRLDTKGMPFGSWHVAVAGKTVVKESGFHTFPFAISRYVVAPGETYGRSPAMLALPSIKTLNEEKKTVLKQGHRTVDPVLLAHDDGVIDGFSLRPGDINAGGVTSDGKLLVHALPVGDLSLAKEMMETEARVINDAFLVTLFQILVDTPQMTATEVLERAREKGALLSPTMGRQQSEFLGPMQERELDVLAQQNLLPPMPDIVRQANAEYDTMYDSPLSRAQRAENASGLMNYVNWLRDVIAVTQDPSPLDYINWDMAAPDLALIQAVPTKWLRDAEGVAAIRAARAQAANEQKMIDAAPAMAGVAKALPSIRLGGQVSGSV